MLSMPSRSNFSWHVTVELMRKWEKSSTALIFPLWRTLKRVEETQWFQDARISRMQKRTLSPLLYQATLGPSSLPTLLLHLPCPLKTFLHEETTAFCAHTDVCSSLITAGLSWDWNWPDGFGSPTKPESSTHLVSCTFTFASLSIFLKRRSLSE